MYRCRRAICPFCKREIAILADPNGYFARHGLDGALCIGSGYRENEDFKKRLAERIKTDRALLKRLSTE